MFAAAVQAGIADAPDQVAGGVCGAFLGPGSQAIAVTRRGQQCDPNLIWTVLRFSGGAWQQVPGPWDDSGRILGVAAVGEDLREEQLIFRASDRGCDPTGGSRARTGTGTAAWHRAVRRGPPPPIRGHSHVRRLHPRCRCLLRHARRTATGGRCLRPAGPAVRREDADQRASQDLPLPQRPRRRTNPPEAWPRGSGSLVGRFRCQVRGFALTCTVTATGKGSVLTDAGTVRRVGSSAVARTKPGRHDTASGEPCGIGEQRAGGGPVCDRTAASREAGAALQAVSAAFLDAVDTGRGRRERRCRTSVAWEHAARGRGRGHRRRNLRPLRSHDAWRDSTLKRQLPAADKEDAARRPPGRSIRSTRGEVHTGEARRVAGAEDQVRLPDRAIA